jgi:hypothetical protein
MAIAKMNFFGIAMIFCGLALICASLILQVFRRGEPASLEEAVEPFVPQPWVDPHSDEAPK